MGRGGDGAEDIFSLGTRSVEAKSMTIKGRRQKWRNLGKELLGKDTNSGKARKEFGYSERESAISQIQENIGKLNKGPILALAIVGPEHSTNSGLGATKCGQQMWR